MSLRSRSGQLPARLYFALMTALVVVLGHALTLAIGDAHGETPALTATRHGEAWMLEVGLIAMGILGVAVGVIWRIRSMQRQLLALARSLPHPRRPQALEMLRRWRNLFVVALAVFVAQENAEHLFAHGHLPGVAVLVDGAYAAAIPAFASASLVVATIWTACRQRIAALTDAITAVERWLGRAPRTVSRPAGRAPDRRATERQRSGHATRRAPPSGVPA